MQRRSSIRVRAGAMLLLAALSAPLGGCVIAVGNSLASDSEWKDDEERPRMGVVLAPVSDAMAAQLGIDRRDATLVSRVMDGLPADRAGVKEFDVVVAVDGKGASPDDLRRAIRGAKPGASMVLSVIRGGEKREVTVVLSDGESADTGE